MYIQEIEKLDFNTDKQFQEKIDMHPIMRKEVSVQSVIIKFLIARSTIEREDLNTLLLLQGIGNGSLNLNAI